MKRIDENIYVVHEITDFSIQPVVGRFTNSADAAKVAKLVGGYGGRVSAERIEFIIFDSFDEYMDYKRGDLRKSALAKLSNEERIALGIKTLS